MRWSSSEGLRAALLEAGCSEEVRAWGSEWGRAWADCRGRMQASGRRRWRTGRSTRGAPWWKSWRRSTPLGRRCRHRDWIEASLIADAVLDRKVYFPNLSEAQKLPVQTVLGPRVNIANPLDYHTYCWGNREIMEAAYTGMVQNDFALHLLVLDFPHHSRCDDAEWAIAVDAIEAALKEATDA